MRTVSPAHSNITIAVSEDLPSCAADWMALEERATSTLYQSFLWCRAWMETVGAAWRVRPVIVRGQRDGVTLFLLPLQIRRRQGADVLEWLGSPHLGYGFPMLDPAFGSHADHWFSAHWDQLLACLPAHDAMCLADNPHGILGLANPLAPYFNLRGPNQSFVLSLEPDFESLYARKRSGSRRRTARKNENALESSGALQFGLPADTAATHELLDTMFAQQERRLAELGVHGVFGPVERRFIHHLADLQDWDRPILAPYVLRQGEDVLAVMLGGLHAGTYWALVSSLTAGPTRRHSPGDIALRRTIADACARGLSAFDFSLGDSDYKRQWADQTIDLSFILRARSYKGLAWSFAMAGRLTAKRIIKTTPWLHDLSKMLRQALFGRTPRP